MLDNNKIIDKIQIIGTPYFFIYHNNIPKYVTLPQYKIDLSEDIKIKMGYITTYTIQTVNKNKSTNQTENDLIEMNKDELENNNKIEDMNKIEEEEEDINKIKVMEEIEEENKEEIKSFDYFNIYRIGYSLDKVDSFNSKENKKILSKNDNIDVITISKEGGGDVINVWKKHYSNSSELFITVIGEEVLKINAKELWSKIHYLMEKYFGKIEDNKIESILCTIHCNS